MSKAEDLAEKLYPKKEHVAYEPFPCEEPNMIDDNKPYRIGFVEGYHQAEKDLELTWEDMRELYIIFAEIDVDIELCKTDIKSETLGYYQEVLKRFKDYKERKEK